MNVLFSVKNSVSFTITYQFSEVYVTQKFIVRRLLKMVTFLIGFISLFLQFVDDGFLVGIFSVFMDESQLMSASFRET